MIPGRRRLVESLGRVPGHCRDDVAVREGEGAEDQGREADAGDGIKVFRAVPIDGNLSSKSRLSCCLRRWRRDGR